VGNEALVAAAETFAGEVVRIAYRHPENDWSVLRVLEPKSGQEQTVVGHTACQVGQTIEALGKWTDHAQFGRQFLAERIVASNPTTPDGVAAYLGSGVLPGVGAKVAGDLVAHFGVHVLHILDDEPGRLTEVRGIGRVRAAAIRAGWDAEQSAREIMVFLHSQQIPAFLCRRIHKKYGADAIHVIKENPYRLCAEVRGIGFKTADEIAAGLSIPRASPYRLAAGLRYTMEELAKNGHCGAERSNFIRAATEILEVDPALVEASLDEALAITEKPPFVYHEGYVYDAELAEAEELIAKVLRGSARRSPWYAKMVTDDLIRAAADGCGMPLAEKQWSAVQNAMKRGVSIITGGPGCGKTATLRVLLDVCDRLKLSVQLAAPTGKAAQRASEASGREAKTIHRLLRLRGMVATSDVRITCDVLVVDEASMVDVRLMAKIVRALGPNTVLILVGDVDQLPSVGPGRVLADLIQGGVVPVTVLNKIFRQAEGSAIITNAHAINAGKIPSSSDKDGDFFVLTEEKVPAIRAALDLEDKKAIPAAAAKATADEIVDLVSTRLPARYGFDPIRDIQVLAPMKDGACGVDTLNQRLQEALNPRPTAHVDRGSYRLGVGDRVIQTSNDYDLDIFNGDVGIIEYVDREEKFLGVRFDSRLVDIPFEQADELRLAYAMTIHKSQGSQAPAVLVPMVTQHWKLLQRNLLYTGVTRASRLVVVVGQSRALGTAVRTVEARNRVTRLGSLLSDTWA